MLRKIEFTYEYHELLQHMQKVIKTKVKLPRASGFKSNPQVKWDLSSAVPHYHSAFALMEMGMA